MSFILLMILTGCNKKNKENIEKPRNSTIAAIIENQIITIENIDSIIYPQIYELRLNSLDILISGKILEYEAQKQNIPLKELVEKEINKKCKKVTNEDFNNYISRLNITQIDTSNILSYLLTIQRKERQTQYVDSLKHLYSIKIKLQPTVIRTIETSGLYSHNLTNNNSKIEVFIISDFKCPACQKAEKSLKNLYEKYNYTIAFKFIYFSNYIDKDALACEAAAKQNKFRQMHDVIIKNTELLHQDSIYYDFAKKIGLNINEFNKDMKDNQDLKKLLNNKEHLISNEIYSTPTFIVNGKVLDAKYAIDYLEDIIIEELISNR